MALKTVFVCSNCGNNEPKWMGKCNECGEWNTFVEEITDKKNNAKETFNIINNTPKSLDDIKSGEKDKFDTNIQEMNRVLGGGIVKGSLVLISGEPGIGKSTLLLQVANNISSKYGEVLYITGEESEEQIKIRANRLKITSKKLFIVSETMIQNIDIYIEKIKPVFVIIDSIQTMYSNELSSAPGSVSQVRENANRLLKMSKGTGISFFIVAHVTKQGELAGPRVLEHMVDAVLSFEGNRSEEFRFLRTMKNRFGATSEIGMFEMKEIGLEEVKNPSDIFIEDSSLSKEGSAIIGIMEGNRPIFVELQALVVETKAVMPRRTIIGVEQSRVNLILAVLEKRLRIPFYNKDVYINVVGGLNIEGTSADLAIALAIISSIKNIEIMKEKFIVLGEIGLTGEIRKVISIDRILKEGEKLGFTHCIAPQKSLKSIQNTKLNMIYADTLMQCASKIFKK